MSGNNTIPASAGAAGGSSTIPNGPSNPTPSPNNGPQGRSRGGGGRGRGNQRGGGRKGYGSKSRGWQNGRAGMGRSDSKGAGSTPRGGQNGRVELGRSDYKRQNIDKRQRNTEQQAAKRRKLADGEAVASPFTKEEIEAEARQPKRKVAVMIGYAGTGYKGMQINATEKTIEGDLFNAFIKASAISKANADDPKKSSLVRCARTDKGVHAAGNVISLKLIVEDPDIVQKINEHLPAQIRVWGIERTNGSFSCYQTCDSRWYEYLIPTFAFVPPHPRTYLAQKLDEAAERRGVLDEYKERQNDVKSFWESAEETYVKPILDKLDPELAASVMAAVHMSESDLELDAPSEEAKKKNAEPKSEEEADKEPNAVDDILPEENKTDMELKHESEADTAGKAELNKQANLAKLSPLDAAVKEVKAAYIKAKKAYRISEIRRLRVQEALNSYLGTQNFHNYTIQKAFLDPSAKRVIRSFNVGPKPIIINDTEWLSLKVHGQSFMMHQIRKMVAMAALVVRCSSPLSIVQDSYGPTNISIPKAPGLGLLLERPVFDSYNDKAESEYNKEKIDFDKYQKEMDEFKQREIYDRIFREEERDHPFHDFFTQIDRYRNDCFLWVTADGIDAAKARKGKAIDLDISDDEADPNGQEG